MHNQRTNRCCGTARPRWHEASPARSSLPAWCSVRSPLHHGRAFPSAATQTNAHKRPSQSFLFIIKCSPQSASIKTFHLNHPPFNFIFFYSIILFACVSQCHSVCWANRVTILAQGCESCLRAALFYYVLWQQMRRCCQPSELFFPAELRNTKDREFLLWFCFCCSWFWFYPAVNVFSCV